MTYKIIELCTPPIYTLCFQGRYILIVFETCNRQNGHRETADEHRRHNTCPHGTNVISISLLKHILHSHAAFAVSASFIAISDFSYKYSPQKHLFTHQRLTGQHNAMRLFNLYSKTLMHTCSSKSVA